MEYQIASNGIGFSIPAMWQGQVVGAPWDAYNDYFFVDISTLDFPGEPFLDGLNLWPGAEWLADKPQWSSVYDKNDRANRAYVWKRRPGEKLVVVDKLGKIRLLQQDENLWELCEPASQEVVDYLCQAGEMARSVRVIDFVRHNLERMAEAFDLNLQNEIAQLRRQRQGYRRSSRP